MQAPSVPRPSSAPSTRLAILRGSPDYADYRFVGNDHNEMGRVHSLIYTMDSNDVHIYGEGTINMSGHCFYDLSKRIVPPYAQVELTPEQYAECTATYEHRPNQPLFFLRCKHIRVEGIRIVDSPCWTLTFVEYEDVRVLDLTIDNDLRLPNNDGMHFCSCKDVVIRGCNVSAGDDCIALTCITDWNKPCQDFVISDCVLRSCSKAIVIGYMHSIVRNVTVTNCVVRESNRAFCVMSSTGENAIAAVGQDDSVENVHFDHLTMQLKDSDNLCIKGRVIDISPAENDAFLPEEPTWLYLRGVKDVTVTNAYVAPFHGEQPVAYVENCRNVCC